MPHDVTHELTRTVKGMKIGLKFKCPYALTVDRAFEIGEKCLDEISKIIGTEFEKDPSQRDLLDEDAAGESLPE